MKDFKRQIQSQNIKHQIKSLIDRQLTEPTTELQTYRSSVTNETECTQQSTDRSYKRLSTQLRNKQSNSADKNNIINILNPLLQKKNIDISTIDPSQNFIITPKISQLSSQLMSPIREFNQSQ